MGTKTTIGALVALAVAGYLLSPQIKSKVNSYIPSPDKVVRDVKESVGLENKTKNDPLIRSDGTRMESWNYNGNTWPAEKWPIQNPDGTYNRDYIKWYEERHR